MKAAINMKKGAFQPWLTRGSSERADRQRLVRGAVVATVADTKKQVWKEFEDTMEKNFQLASRKFWKTL